VIACARVCARSPVRDCRLTVGSPGAPPVRGRLPLAAAMLWPGVDLPLSTVDVAEKRELLRSAGFEAWHAGDETAG
jgi:hypothetical protein